jgi:hypothetical protein
MEAVVITVENVRAPNDNLGAWVRNMYTEFYFMQFQDALTNRASIVR